MSPRSRQRGGDETKTLCIAGQAYGLPPLPDMPLMVRQVVYTSGAAKWSGIDLALLSNCRVDESGTQLFSAKIGY
jgi:hypothetical protein